MKWYYDKEFDGIVGTPNSADNILHYIWAYGCDYDGCNTVDNLKDLIDDIVKMSQDAREYIEKGWLNDSNPEVIAEDKATYEQALKDQEEYRNTDEYKERFHENLGG